MKRLLFIWFIAVSIAWRPAINIELDFFEKTELDGMVYAIPGAIGDGVTDDTAAVQAWIDGGSVSGTPSPSDVFLVTSTLTYDSTIDNETSDWNGATVKAGAALNPIIDIDKPDIGDQVTIRNLNIDGNGTGQRGIWVSSYSNVQNLTIDDLYANGTAVTGIYFEQIDDRSQDGHYIWEDLTITNLKSQENSVIGDQFGLATGIIVDKDDADANVRYTFLRGSIDNTYGDDGDNVITINTNQSVTDLIPIEFIDYTFGNMDRRHTKVTSGFTHFIGCTFNVPSSSNPEIGLPCCGTTAGLIGDGQNTPGFKHKYINCVFDGRGGHNSLRNMYIVKTNDLEINGCTFYNYDILFEDINVNGVEIINNNCPNNDCNIGHATGTLDPNDIGLANNTGFTNNLNAGTYYTISSPKAVHSCSDGLLSPGEFTIDSGGVCDLTSVLSPSKTKVFTRRRL